MLTIREFLLNRRSDGQPWTTRKFKVEAISENSEIIEVRCPNCKYLFQSRLFLNGNKSILNCEYLQIHEKPVILFRCPKCKILEKYDGFIPEERYDDAKNG